jgi:hypothetical protein
MKKDTRNLLITAFLAAFMVFITPTVENWATDSFPDFDPIYIPAFATFLTFILVYGLLKKLIKKNI